MSREQSTPQQQGMKNETANKRLRAALSRSWPACPLFLAVSLQGGLDSTVVQKHASKFKIASKMPGWEEEENVLEPRLH